MQAAEQAKRRAVGTMLTAPIDSAVVRKVVGDRSGYPMTPEIEERVQAYRSTGGFLDEAVERARALVLQSRPASAEDAAKLMTRVSHFLTWSIEQGHDVDEAPTELLSERRIERFQHSSDMLTRKSAQTFVSALRRVRRAVTTERKAILSDNADQESAVAPYSPDDIAVLLNRATILREESVSRRDYEALLLLTLGAGLQYADHDHVRGHGIWRDASGDVWVRVDDGPRPRVVFVDPALAPLAQRVAASAGGQPLFDRDNRGRTSIRGRANVETLQHRMRTEQARGRRNSNSPFVMLNSQRARVTWLVRRIEDNRHRIDVLAEQAGLDSIASLSRYFQFLRAPEWSAPQAPTATAGPA